MHRSESGAYTVLPLCFKYCIFIRCIYVMYFNTVCYIYIYDTARFCFLYSTHMLVKKSNKPFILPMWCCNTQITKQPAKSLPNYLSISLISPSKQQEILNAVKEAIWATNPDYETVIKRLHLYYDMKLVTFGIDRDRNLIIQFPIFVQPYMQQPLILYQIETVPVLITDQNKQSNYYTLANRQALHFCQF